ncbi:MAG: cation:proton antiporter, partial [Acidimicrobiales bacterium]
LGLFLASVIHSSHVAGASEAGRFWPFALFVGVTLSITAFPVLARILTDRGLQRTEIGSSALACAAIADVIAWTLLAVVLVVVRSEGAGTLPIHLVELAVFVTVMFTVIKPLLAWLAQRYPDAPHAAVLIVVAVGLFTASFLTERMGVHQMFGAFLFGCAMPRSATTKPARDTVDALKQLGLLFLPVFFVVTGFSVQVTSLGTDAFAQLPLIIALAVVGKVVGTTAAARAQGVPANRATALGVLMNTRGLTELIVLNVGKELGILNTSLFTMLVFMALITTLMTAPLLRIPWLRRVLDKDLELLGDTAIRPDGAPG